MKRLATGAAAFAAILLHASWASAGVYADDLTKCIVQSSGTEGQEIFVRWLFISMSKNPIVKPYVTASDEQQVAINRDIAALWERLTFTDCRKETVAAIKYEGPQSLNGAFQVLGQVAARNLMTDPGTAAAMVGYIAYLDKDKLAALFKDAGLPPPNLPPPPQ